MSSEEVINVSDELLRDTFVQARDYGINFLENYSKGKFLFFDGVIHLQAWSGRSSTESRLFVNSLSEIVEYDPSNYEDKYQFYNSIYRMNVLHSIDAGYVPRKGTYDFCNDCGIEYFIWKKYLGEYSSGERINKFRDELTRYSNVFKNKYHGNIFSSQDIIENINLKFCEMYLPLVKNSIHLMHLPHTDFIIRKCLMQTASKNNILVDKIAEAVSQKKL
jgi:hypothetical protein